MCRLHESSCWMPRSPRYMAHLIQNGDKDYLQCTKGHAFRWSHHCVHHRSRTSSILKAPEPKYMLFPSSILLPGQEKSNTASKVKLKFLLRDIKHFPQYEMTVNLKWLWTPKRRGSECFKQVWFGPPIRIHCNQLSIWEEKNCNSRKTEASGELTKWTFHQEDWSLYFLQAHLTQY